MTDQHFSGSPNGVARRSETHFVTGQPERTGFRAALDAWWQDVRFADRQFRRTPGFTAVAVLTLSLGIGANAAIFSVVHRVLLQPLPYPDGNRIVMFSSTQDDVTRFPTVDMLRAIIARSHTVETVAAARVEGVAVQEDDARDTVYALVTPTYLKMLGVAPALGRSFTPGEARGEAPPVAMISYSRWKGDFGGRANAIGSLVEVNYICANGPERRWYTIVGVAPPTMALPMSPLAFNKNLHAPRPGVWLPFDLSRGPADARPSSYARLRPGVSPKQATQELQRIIDTSPEVSGRRPIIKLLRAQDLVDPSQTRMIEVLFAAVGVLLLIACANVANLLMSRAWTRRREFAVRAALGAGRGRLARQVLTESTLLALAGGLGGVVVARYTLRIIIALRPPALANLDEVQVEPAVLLWTAGIAVLTGVLFGTLPALFAARGSVAEVLRGETRGGAGSVGTRQVRSALTVFEIALSLVLLINTGLLVRSFAAMERTPLGFEPRGMVSFDVIFNPRTSRDPAVRSELRNQIVEQLRAVPGVTDAAIGMLPAAGFGGTGALSTDPDSNGVVNSVREFSTIFIGSNYFRVAGIRLSEGRGPDSRAALPPASASIAGPLTSADTAALQAIAGAKVLREVVINRGLATRFWPRGGAIGARFHEQMADQRGQEYIVVGIAEEVRVPGLSELARSAVLYQAPRFASFIVRTATPGAALVPSMRRAISAVEPTPFIQTTTVGETFVRDSLAPTRFAMALMGAFAVVALVLAIVGLYGVVSYGVSQRTKEIGVRVALGAQPLAVVRLVIGDGLRLAAIGLAIGVVGAIAATRALSGMLYGVSAGDPMTFVGTTLLVAAVALLASYMPARRALRMHPAEVLRGE